MSNIEELERRAEIELAKLGVAEELGWAVAVLAGCAVYLKWENWIVTTAVVLVGYFLVTWPYRKREKEATDAYQKASRTGKYFRPPEQRDAA